MIAESDTGWFTISDLSKVPLDVLHGALRTARLLVADVELEIARRSSTAPAIGPAPEQAVRIGDACPRMGLTYGYAIRHWRRLGGFKDVDGRVKFPCSVVARRANGAAS